MKRIRKKNMKRIRKKDKRTKMQYSNVIAYIFDNINQF